MSSDICAGVIQLRTGLDLPHLNSAWQQYAKVPA
jgi:hypothetical protein